MLHIDLVGFVSVAGIAASLALQDPTPIVVQITPETGLAALPPQPEPEECPTDRRIGDAELAELAARLDGAAPLSEDEMAGILETRDFVVPTGEPVDEATAEAVEIAVRQVLACVNAGDGRAVFGLLSGDARDRMPDAVLKLLDSVFPQSPQALDPPARFGYSFIDGVVRLPDGRIGAMINVRRPPNIDPSVHRDFAFFREEDGRLALDGVVPDAAPPPSTTLEATPTP